MDIKALLKRMSETAGVSGYETAVSEIVSTCPWADDTRTDPLGSLILTKRGTRNTDGTRPKVMLAAHMDEIGLIVSAVEKGGFLRFDTIGGFDQRVLLAQEVVVHGRKVLPGIIGAKPPHIQKPDERKKAVPLDELFIDVGFESAEAVQEFVQVGDLITLRAGSTELQGSMLSGKAMDDRASVAVMFECLKVLQSMTHTADVYATATVQEETGYRGAITSTFGIMPDVGIAIDVGHGDMPGVPESDSIKVGGGPGIGLGPHVHPKLHERFVKTARDWNIPYSIEPSPYPGGTDAFAIQVTQMGIPTILLSLPLRYMHTPVETLDYEDVQRTGRLIAIFISELESEFVEGLRCF